MNAEFLDINTGEVCLNESREVATDSCEGGGITPSFLRGTGFEVCAAAAAIAASPVPSIQASSFGSFPTCGGQLGLAASQSFPTCGGQLGVAASLALARLLPNLLCDMPLGTAEPDVVVASDSDGPTIIDESFGSLPSCGGSEPFMVLNQANTREEQGGVLLYICYHTS